jgi:hypothetical protein
MSQTRLHGGDVPHERSWRILASPQVQESMVMLCRSFKALLLVWTRTHATPCSGSSHCRSDSRSHLVGNSSLSTLTLDVASVTQFQPLGLSCSISIVTRIIVSDPCRTTHHISPNNPPRTEVTIKVNAPLLQAAPRVKASGVSCIWTTSVRLD